MTTEQRERIPRPAFQISRGRDPHEVLIGTEMACYTMDDAVEYIQQKAKYWHHVYQSLELPYLSAKPLGDAMLPTAVELSISGKTVTLPRSNGETPGVSFQTHPNYKYMYSDIVNLIFNIGEYNDQDLDRGCAWVAVGTNPVIHYSISPRERSDEQVRAIFSKVGGHVVRKIAGYIEGKA